MNMFKFVIWLKGSHLKFFIPETQGPIKHLTYYLLCFCQNGELGQPNMWRTKLKLVKESFKNWLYFALSIIIQASYKHCWKSQLEYPLACQKCLGEHCNVWGQSQRAELYNTNTTSYNWEKSCWDTLIKGDVLRYPEPDSPQPLPFNKVGLFVSAHKPYDKRYNND